MIRVNLVPRDILDKELQRQRNVLLGVGVGAVLFFFAGISFKHYYKGVMLTAELEDEERKLKKLEKIVKQVEELERQARAVKARLNVMQDLIRARPLYPTFMTEFLKTLPEGVWVRNIDTKGTSKRLEVKVLASALSVEEISEWVRTLDDSALFNAPSVGSLNIEKGVVKFMMSSNFAYQASK